MSDNFLRALRAPYGRIAFNQLQQRPLVNGVELPITDKDILKRARELEQQENARVLKSTTEQRKRIAALKKQILDRNRG